MTTYEQAGDVIKALVAKVLSQNHPELAKEKVTIDTIVARRESRKEGAIVALKKDGHAVLAQIKITSLQDRSRGIADAKLVIDDYGWLRLSDVRKTAVIDHAMEHLTLAKSRASKRNGYFSGPKRDDLGRPMLKIRPHDWVLTGFKSVTERHGDNSVEANQFTAFKAEFGQLNLFGADVLQIAHNGKAKRQKKARVGA